jgi:hypothetical protein
MTNWLLFVYKVPSEPSARRVYVWRKLKNLGAILLHDAVWVLPATSRNREQFQWLAAEIKEMEGEALLWEAQQFYPAEDERLVQQFTAQVEDAYQAILAALVDPDPDLTALSRRYQQAQSRDYFQSSLGEQVRTRLIDARGGNDV